MLEDNEQYAPHPRVAEDVVNQEPQVEATAEQGPESPAAAASSDSNTIQYVGPDDKYKTRFGVVFKESPVTLSPSAVEELLSETDADGGPLFERV
jgi:hypothetical protein